MEFSGKLLQSPRKDFGQNGPWIVYSKGPQSGSRRSLALEDRERDVQFVE
jgi:hypothetical protein